LAQKLKDEHSFEMLSLDPLYVERIRKHCPFLYFPDLSQFIAHHYLYILNAKEYIYSKYQRDLVDEWHQHLYAQVSALSADFDNAVVEGWLLKDCLGEVVARMSETAQVFPIKVVERTYHHDGSVLTIGEIAALGASGERTA
jgi:hypothetical protein